MGLLSPAGDPLASKLKRPVVALVPAAGKGERLDFDGPKVLFPINGIPALDYVYGAVSRFVSEFRLVVCPLHRDRVASYAQKRGLRISLVVQSSPTGMGDAVLCAEPENVSSGAEPDYLIIWGDQVTVSRETVLLCLLHHQYSDRKPVFTFPTSVLDEPYIHFERDDSGTIIGLLQSREGDEMPAVGETDCGIFVVGGSVLFRGLKELRKTEIRGSGTKEFNFLPFIVWLTERGYIVDGLPIGDVKETRGINTLDDVDLITGELGRE